MRGRQKIPAWDLKQDMQLACLRATIKNKGGMQYGRSAGLQKMLRELWAGDDPSILTVPPANYAAVRGRATLTRRMGV